VKTKEIEIQDDAGDIKKIKIDEEFEIL